MPADQSAPVAAAPGPVGRAGGPTRRGALLASLALVATTSAACGDVAARQDAPPDGTDRRAGTVAATGGDEEVLAAVRAELAQAYVLVAATLDQHRSLRQPLGELQATRAAQLNTLDPEGEATTPERPVVPRDASLAVARVRRAEERLQRRLLTWAVAVDSGSLARVLAAAAAGTAQHLAVLPGGELA